MTRQSDLDKTFDQYDGKEHRELQAQRESQSRSKEGVEISPKESARHLLSNDAWFDGMNMYAGHLHAHSNLSDGTLDPATYYNKAKSAGLDFVALTEHNHRVLEQKDKSDGPVVAVEPEKYGKLFKTAREVSEDGKFIALAGMEMGSIGKTGKEGSGVNHINMFEVETFYEAILNSQESFLEILRSEPVFKRDFKGSANFGQLAHESKEYRQLPYSKASQKFSADASESFKPQTNETNVIKYPNTNYKELFASVATTPDTRGERPVVQLNHPRYKEDENSNYPPNVRGKDYGTKSYASDEEWRQDLGKYARIIEAIRTKGNIDTISFQGMLDKGLYLAPSYGPDDHFGEPGNFKGATLLPAKHLTKDNLLDAMSELRTGATSNRFTLQGVMGVENKYLQGTIFEDNAVKDLNFAVKVTSDIDPKSNYRMKLWGDTKLGDHRLAQVVGTKEYTGEELLKSGGTVQPFEHIQYAHSQNNAFYVEVERAASGGSFSSDLTEETVNGSMDLRTSRRNDNSNSRGGGGQKPRPDDGAQGQSDRLFTAPVWVVTNTEAKRLVDTGVLTPNVIRSFAETKQSLPATLHLPNSKIYKY
jgi:hypothetical protein